MDHFNVTVAQNGKLISTRRGLQVSKQKFNGTSFVNSYPQASNCSSSADPDSSQLLQRKFKFVTKQKEPKKPSVRNKAKDVDNKDSEEETRNDQAKKPARRRNTTRSDDNISVTSASQRPSPEQDGLQPSFSVTAQDFYDIADIGNPTPSIPTWATHDLPSYMTGENRKMFHNYFSVVPRKMYPFEAVLDYNPSRSYDFYYLVINDLAALHCVLMCGTMFESIAKGEMSSKDLSYHISKKMIEMNGGLEGVRPALLSKIRKTDIKGAATLGSSPYFPFSRLYKNASDTLPEATRQEIVNDVTAVLSPSNISPPVLTSVSNLAKLVNAYAYAKTSRLVTFDPNEFTEEYQAVQHALVCEPGPLRSGARPGTPEADVDPIDPSWLKTEDFIKNHQAAIAPVIPAEHGNTLDPLLRICSLLYLKELLPDFPRNLGGYSILLSLLTHQLRQLIDENRVKTAVNYHHLTSDDVLDPRLLDWTAENDDEDWDGKIVAMKPALVWVCLIGNLSSLIGDKNECRFGADHYDRSAYRECLAEVVGLSVDTVDDLTDSDLNLCQLLDIRWIQDGKWDDKSALKRILSEAVYE
ncbi:hypothetical protein UCRPA7_82 [Phaeoacremonium minimum UCRPA7]|uniref:Uncharacterized protein n=1 Tax=Phaeoacremonium minimum (strain UCR-PA7) TaxID=1286976 RepID=R8BYK3_PHAM7|nr:hypothetical protein UCRPA7_82 [Phaeoacremonium minimum UCRPA7]EOO04405.1 hypothetical protein UCRPA7_82 [Phaeoacremonium minimum UCRPA7]